MLRDKFIHYFQQWRERQFSRGEHWLTQHLAGRSPREKQVPSVLPNIPWWSGGR